MSDDHASGREVNAKITECLRIASNSDYSEANRDRAVAAAQVHATLAVVDVLERILADIPKARPRVIARAQRWATLSRRMAEFIDDNRSGLRGSNRVTPA